MGVTVTNNHIHRLLGLGPDYAMTDIRGGILIDLIELIPGNRAIITWDGLIHLTAAITNDLDRPVNDHDYADALTAHANEIISIRHAQHLTKITPIHDAVIACGLTPDGPGHETTDDTYGAQYTRCYDHELTDARARVTVSLGDGHPVRVVIMRAGRPVSTAELDAAVPAAAIAALITALSGATTDDTAAIG